MNPLVIVGDEAYLVEEWEAIPHGTRRGYNRDCRCHECRVAESQYRREYLNRPKVRAERRAYQRAYRQRPEVKAARSQYMREYRKRAS